MSGDASRLPSLPTTVGPSVPRHPSSVPSGASGGEEKSGVTHIRRAKWSRVRRETPLYVPISLTLRRSPVSAFSPSSRSASPTAHERRVNEGNGK